MIPKRFFLLVLFGCSSATAVPPTPSWEPLGASEWTPPEIFETWYEDVAECADLPPRKFSEIIWFTVPGDSFPSVLGRSLVGIYIKPRSIYLAENRRTEQWLVKHEMMHDLGVVGHPEPPFWECEF